MNRPRVLVVHDYRGDVVDFYCDSDTAVEVFVAVRKKNGGFVGRPKATAATVDPALVEEAFRLACAPSAAALRGGVKGSGA